MSQLLTTRKIRDAAHSAEQLCLKVDNLLYHWFVRPLSSLLYPRRCPMCGRVLLMDEEGICEKCICSLPRTEEHRHRDNHLEQRFSDPKLMRGAAYCFYPKGHPIRQAIHAFKYDDHMEIGTTLGTRAAEEWRDSGFFEGLDLIIPLPLHPNRLLERGYNQSEIIAKAISRVTGIPVDTTHLVRTMDNNRQSLLSIDERRQLPQIFAVNHPEDLLGKQILLVDDVITSGSTMSRALEVLHPIRNCHYAVFALCLAGEQTTDS